MDSDKLEMVQNKVDDVKIIMKDNIDKALENTANMEVVMEKAEDLQQTAEQFEKHVNKIRCSKKKDVCLCVGVLSALAFLITIIIVYSNRN